MMKGRKIIAIVLVCLLVVACIVIPNTINIAQAEEAYFGISILMDSGMGYSIGKPTNELTNSFARIWNIVQYQSANSNQKVSPQKDIYCLKAGAGTLQASTTSKTQTVTYDKHYDMKKDKDTLKQATNQYVKELMNNIDGENYSKYNALLALFDMIYITDNLDKKELIQTIINENSSSYSDKVEALQNIIDKGEVDTNERIITKDEVKAVQQAVIWYFTNYGEKSGLYDKTANDNTNEWFQYTTDDNGSNYEALNKYKGNGGSSTNVGEMRYYLVDELYKYMIKQVKANVSKYENNANVEAPAKITQPTDSTLSYIASGDNYIFGPIHIDKTASGDFIPFDIEFIVKNGSEEVREYELLDEKKQEVQGKTVEDLVGKDFYISMPKKDLTSVSIDLKIKYETTSVTIWYTDEKNGENYEQPLAIPEKKEEVIEKKASVEPKELDLALRKYITKIETKEGEVTKEKVLSGSEKREPEIDTNTISSATTTATYKHRKDPVEVKTGDIVTYKLTIYNEG